MPILKAADHPFSDTHAPSRLHLPLIMRPLPHFALYLLFLVLSAVAYGQSDIDLYQDFTGDSTGIPPYFSITTNYNGEYQWIYKADSSMPWLALDGYKDLHYSYRI
jgi:hypothetical protein